jgi:hypothetical protein
VLKRKNNPTSSKYKGVWKKRARVMKDGTFKAVKKPWVCEVKSQNRKHTSCHATEVEAAEKYNQIATEWQGEYCVLNNISDSE